ncbi:chromate transporter [Paucibacter sp. KCTC 42545]|uniref:chromate transporter n=1 Tax=Paucibacter sp. KCTC 42545 TaxID=1768242 RepID=UPI000733B7F9|nr:chromate transporter [Paucibacter sp. KCTC 42545]ALT77362.1 chromate transporter [Paucibacter sp. KCTC 42545]
MSPAAEPAGAAGTDETGRARPASLWKLYWAFNRLALQGFGGVLAVAQRELVERLGWLSQEEFLESLAVAQVLPGPNVVNLSLMIGDRFFGVRGAFAALAGMMLLPCILMLSMAALYGQFASHPVVGNALRGMGAVSAGLILATGVKLAPSLPGNPMGRWWAWGLAGLTIVAIAVLRLPLPWVLACLGPLGMWAAWRRLKA